MLKDAICVRDSSEVMGLDLPFWKTLLASVCVEWLGIGRGKHRAGQLKGILLRKIKLARMIYVYKVTYFAKQLCRLVKLLN